MVKKIKKHTFLIFFTKSSHQVFLLWHLSSNHLSFLDIFFGIFKIRTSLKLVVLIDISVNSKSLKISFDSCIFNCTDGNIFLCVSSHAIDWNFLAKCSEYKKRKSNKFTPNEFFSAHAEENNPDNESSRCIDCWSLSSWCIFSNHDSSYVESGNCKNIR